MGKKKTDKKSGKFVPKKNHEEPLKVNMTFDELLKLASNTPPIKKKKK